MECLSWNDVKIKFDNKRSINSIFSKLKLKKVVLKNAHGTAYCKKILAIFGPNNSGKTALLDYLSNTLNRGFTAKGQRYLSSVDSFEMDNYIGYVTQDESFYPYITVFEHIKHYALLRSNSLSKSDVAKKVEQIMKDLNIFDLKNQYLSNENSKRQELSTVQLKLVALSIELLKNPKVLLLDDFFRYIDPYNSVKIMEYLKNSFNMIIICTFSNIESREFNQCDDFLFQTSDGTIFQTDSHTFKKITSSEDFRLIPNSNFSSIYDYFHDSVSKTTTKNIKKENTIASKDFHKIEKRSFFGRFFGQRNSPFMTQLITLILFNLKMLIRKPSSILTRFYQEIATAVFLALSFYGIKYDSEGTEKQPIIIFLECGIVSLSGVIMAALTTPRELKRLSNEIRHKIYSPWMYILAKSISDIPIGSIQVLFFTLISYYGLALRPEPLAFILHYIMLAIAFQNGMSFGILVSTFYGDSTVGMCFATPLMAPLLAMASFLLKESAIPIYIRWLKFISWFPYLYEMLMIINFKDAAIPCVNSASCSRNPIVDGNKYIADFVEREYLYYGDVFIIIGMGIVFRLMSAGCIFLSTLLRNKKNPYAE